MQQTSKICDPKNGGNANMGLKSLWTLKYSQNKQNVGFIFLCLLFYLLKNTKIFVANNGKDILSTKGRKSDPFPTPKNDFFLLFSSFRPTYNIQIINCFGKCIPRQSKSSNILDFQKKNKTVFKAACKFLCWDTTDLVILWHFVGFAKICVQTVVSKSCIHFAGMDPWSSPLGENLQEFSSGFNFQGISGGFGMEESATPPPHPGKKMVCNLTKRYTTAST